MSVVDLHEPLSPHVADGIRAARLRHANREREQLAIQEAERWERVDSVAEQLLAAIHRGEITVADSIWGYREEMSRPAHFEQEAQS